MPLMTQMLGALVVSLVVVGGSVGLVARILLEIRMRWSFPEVVRRQVDAAKNRKRPFLGPLKLPAQVLRGEHGEVSRDSWCLGLSRVARISMATLQSGFVLWFFLIVTELLRRFG